MCGVDLRMSVYECGHKVDRCAGGKDELDNLDAMCIICNRTKPVHETLDQYREWLGGMIQWKYIGHKTMSELIDDAHTHSDEVTEISSFHYYSVLSQYAMPEIKDGVIKWVRVTE